AARELALPAAARTGDGHAAGAAGIGRGRGHAAHLRGAGSGDVLVDLAIAVVVRAVALLVRGDERARLLAVIGVAVAVDEAGFATAAHAAARLAGPQAV